MWYRIEDYGNLRNNRCIKQNKCTTCLVGKSSALEAERDGVLAALGRAMKLFRLAVCVREIE
jgi:hypothetical protein